MSVCLCLCLCVCVCASCVSVPVCACVRDFVFRNHFCLRLFFCLDISIVIYPFVHHFTDAYTYPSIYLYVYRPAPGRMGL